MEIFQLKANNHGEAIKKAVSCLRKGGIILYPTDTCYGLAVDVFNEVAFRKLYQLKGRSYTKPISIMVSSLDEAKKYGQFFELADGIAKKFWPGPLTLVLNKKSSLPNFINIGVDTIGIRVVDFPFVQELVQAYGLPLTTTSANMSGKKEIYSIVEFKKQFKDSDIQPDFVIDAGKLSGSKPSTVAFVSDDAVQILRDGKVTKLLKEYLKRE